MHTTAVMTLADFEFVLDGEIVADLLSLLYHGGSMGARLGVVALRGVEAAGAAALILAYAAAFYGEMRWATACSANPSY